jgi:hypothetical protein
MNTEVDPIQVVLSALAVFRLAELFVYDDGPFEVLAQLRGLAFHSNRFLINVGQAVSCVHCTGLYLSALFAIPFFMQSLYFGFLSLFAIAGIQSALSSRFGRGSV